MKVSLGSQQMIHRQVPENLVLSPGQVHEVFMRRLDELTAHCHKENGKLMEHYDDHYHNGDPMYREFEGPREQVPVILAALHLQELLKER